jgi:hypothetical protein
MGHWYAGHVRGTFETEQAAESCRQSLETFFPVYLDKLRGDWRESTLEDVRDVLLCEHDFAVGSRHLWGKDDAMFYGLPLVSRLGRELLIYFDGCHRRDDFVDIFGPTLKLAGATSLDGGFATHISVYFEVADPSAESLARYEDADWATLAEPAMTSIEREKAQQVVAGLDAFFEGRGAMDEGRRAYEECFGPGRGVFEELVCFQHHLYWTDGVYGGMYIPFDGDSARLQSYFSQGAFRRYRIVWCTDRPFAELRALSQSGPCSECGGALLPTWPTPDQPFAAVECTRCNSRPSLETHDQSGDPESRFSVLMRQAAGDIEERREEAVPEVQGILKEVNDSLSDTIELLPRNDPRNKEAERLVNDLMADGFSVAGYYDIVGVDGVQVTLLVDTERRILGAIMETDSKGIYSEFCVQSREGNEFWVTNLAGAYWSGAPEMVERVAREELDSVGLAKLVGEKWPLEARRVLELDEAPTVIVKAFQKHAAWMKGEPMVILGEVLRQFAELDGPQD